MSWRKFLLLPTLMRSGMRAPKSLPAAWENYWQAVRHTGAGGDVLWDPGHEAELEFCVQKVRAHFDPSLPVLDVGCGNGRFTRVLASLFERTLGMDLSPSAIARARQETPATCRASYRVLSASETGWSTALRAELGPMNVFTRGVWHVLDHQSKRTLASSVRDLLGASGRLFLLETAFPGSALDYLEFLGATRGKLPEPLRRAIASGLPKPRRFSDAELARYLSDSAFRVLESGPATLFTLGMNPGAQVERVPGFFAVLRSAEPAR